MIGVVKNGLVFIALLLVLPGCATHPLVNNITPTLLRWKPDTQIIRIPEYSFENNRTFTVVPSSAFLGDKARLNHPVEEKHLLFMLRNMLEGRGYKFVVSTASPDFIATIDGFSDYRATLVGQKIKIMPLWKLGEVYSFYAGASALHEFPNVSDNVHLWGNYCAGTEVGGHTAGYRPMSSAPQGLLGGFYYPQLTITVFDGKSKQAVWNGLGAGASVNQSFRVASQLVMRSLLMHIPLSKYRFDLFPRSAGRVGVGYAIASIDGNNYYPLVTGISANGLARKAGIHTADFIVAINGIATLNKSMGETARLLAGGEGNLLNLKIWRMGQYLDFVIKRSPRLTNEQHVVADSLAVQPCTKQISDQSSHVLHLQFKALAMLTETVQQQLDVFAETFRGETITRLMVVAHADSSPIRASSRRLYADNYALSQARAENVAEYLQRALKLSNERVSVQGRGADEPVANNTTVAGRAKNRRVEITITRLVYPELSDAGR